MVYTQTPEDPNSKEYENGKAKNHETEISHFISDRIIGGFNIQRFTRC